MKEVRYNLSTKFYSKENSLFIFVSEKKLSLKFSKNIYDFFVFLAEHIIINDIQNIITKF